MSAGDSDWTMSCYGCGREAGRRALVQREVPIHDDEGMGYEMVPVPLCRGCVGERFGYDCPQCGLTHDEKDDARYCCQRRPGEAPDCPECGRRMERGAFGYDPATGPTVEWAECEACGIGWGKYTGWHGLDAEESEA